MARKTDNDQVLPAKVQATLKHLRTSIDKLDLQILDLVNKRSGFAAAASGPGYRVVVQLRPQRKQAVYVGPAGLDADDRPIVAFASICGPANVRDIRPLMMLNARLVEGHFAIRVLRGEEYFVVIHNVTAATLETLDSERLFTRIAETADGLEGRLLRGLDIY